MVVRLASAGAPDAAGTGARYLIPRYLITCYVVPRCFAPGYFVRGPGHGLTAMIGSAKW